MNKKELLKTTIDVCNFVNKGCAGASIAFKLAKCSKYNKKLCIIVGSVSAIAILSEVALNKDDIKEALNKEMPEFEDEEVE